MTCAAMEPLLVRIAGCEGTPRLALDAARHLATCAACAETLLRLREVGRLLDSLPEVEVPAAFPRRVLRALSKKTRGAGGALVLAALSMAGAAIAFGGAGRAWSAISGGPAGSDTTALAALVELARSLLAMILTGSSASRVQQFRPPDLSFPPSVHVAVLVVLAALMLAASFAAFGGGALSLRYARRSSSRSPLV